MRTLYKGSGAATPSPTTRADKKSANLTTNRTLNFLVGLAAALMIAFVIMELQSPVNEYRRTMSIPVSENIPTNLDVFQIEQPQPVAQVQRIQKPVVNTSPVNAIKPPVIIENTAPDPVVQAQPNTSIKLTAPTTNSTLRDNAPVPVPNNTTYNLLTVTDVPIYPGCESAEDNDERTACLNNKMARFVQRYFDTSQGNDITGTSLINITVLFSIGTNGLPRDIQVRAPNEKLKNEALRIISKLPKMTPGKFNGAAVKTTYALPIKFKIQQ